LRYASRQADRQTDRHADTLIIILRREAKYFEICINLKSHHCEQTRKFVNVTKRSRTASVVHYVSFLGVGNCNR